MDMELWQFVVLLLAGTVAGFLNVVAGGGSLLTVPVLLFMGLPGPVANGTNRIAILAQNATAVTTFFRMGYSDFRLSLSLAAAALPGALIGALVGSRFGGEGFDRFLALVMVAVMIVMATQRNSKKGQTENADSSPGHIPRRRLLWGHIFMVGAGFWGGFIQVGIGFILMPILHRVMGLDLVRVNMHKVFIVLIYTIVALIVFASQVEIVWTLGLALAAGNSLGGWIGAHITISKGERAIRYVLYTVLTAFVIKLLFF